MHPGDVEDGVPSDPAGRRIGAERSHELHCPVLELGQRRRADRGVRQGRSSRPEQDARRHHTDQHHVRAGADRPGGHEKSERPDACGDLDQGLERRRGRAGQSPNHDPQPERPPADGEEPAQVHHTVTCDFMSASRLSPMPETFRRSLTD